jgi:hypothetical protein
LPDPLRIGVTYLPYETGIHQWQEFSAERTEHDLGLIRSQGFENVRLHLAWDAFMPSHRHVDRSRLRDLEVVLTAMRAQRLRCDLVVLAQSHGDCIQLPAYAVDPRRVRRGVRVVVDGRVVDGGPRDLWADPLMLEAAELWLRTLLEAFANHPAVSAWDLGHDPATTLRPRRLAHMVATVDLLAALVRRHEDAVRLTLGSGDVLSARGVRLAPLANLVDTLGLVIDPYRLAVNGADPVRAAAFTLALAERLVSGGEPAHPIDVITGVAIDDHPELPPPVMPAPRTDPHAEAQPPPWDVVPLIPTEGARLTSELLGRLSDGGATGLAATSWCVGGPRTLAAPPCDRMPSLARHGLAARDGALREQGHRWAELALRESTAGAPAPLAAALDVQAYYANLPESASDLFTAWSADQGEA